MPSIRLADLAQQLDAELHGDGDIVITGGTVIVPGGEAGMTAENGKVTISGGAVREP